MANCEQYLPCGGRGGVIRDLDQYCEILYYLILKIMSMHYFYHQKTSIKKNLLENGECQPYRPLWRESIWHDAF